MDSAFKALADPTRREILRLLRAGPMSAGGIANHFALAKPTLSGHFQVLKAAGLAAAERVGTSQIYHLNMTVLQETVMSLHSMLDLGTVTKTKGKK